MQNQIIKRHIHAPYIVQTGSIKGNVFGLNFGLPLHINQMIQWNYMGAAEYEFNATGRSLEAMLALSKEEGRQLQVRRVAGWYKPGNRHARLVTLSALDEFEHCEFVCYLTRMWDRKIDTKRPHRFTHSDVVSMTDRDRYGHTDLWWDLKNHVMWCFDHDFLEESIKDSVEFTVKAMKGE